MPARASFPNSFSTDSRTRSLLHQFHRSMANCKLWDVTFQNKIEGLSDINCFDTPCLPDGIPKQLLPLRFTKLLCNES